jgi:hypothetical protein
MMTHSASVIRVKRQDAATEDSESRPSFPSTHTTVTVNQPLYH